MTYPTIQPALTLDFAKTQQLDPRIAFTRSSTGTYLDSNSLIKTAPSGVARFDYDSSGNALGLLIEESRTNECKYSEDITPSPWSVNEATVTTNSTTAPDGTTTADALYETTASGDHRLQYGVQLFTKISTSVFVKPNGRNYVSARILSSGNQWSTVVFELTGNGAITKIEDGSTNIITHVDSSIQAVANGWYKISITTNRTSSAFQYPILLGTCTTSNPTLDATLGAELFAGDTTKGIYVWGAQFEYEKDFSTSYIPTSGSTVTRAADLATIPTAGVFGTEFTTINKDFGTAGGSDTLTVVGPNAERTVVYPAHLTQAQINEVTTAEDDDFWRWRVLGSSFALPSFTTDGQVTVDWGDGTVETLTTSDHTFTNGSGYHEIGFRLDSGTYFQPNVSNNATHRGSVIAIGPSPVSMVVNVLSLVHGCGNLKTFDATINAQNGSSDLFRAFRACASLISVPLFDTSGVTSWRQAFESCISLTKLPLFDTSSATALQATFKSCSALTEFPLIDTSNVTGTVNDCWGNCSSLTSFPAIVCNGSNYNEAWKNCTSLANFPANMFDSTSITVGKGHGTSWYNAWTNCALTAQSIENILVSLDTNGASNCQVGIDGGTNAGQSTWTTAATTAYNNLVTKGWTIDANP